MTYKQRIAVLKKYVASPTPLFTDGLCDHIGMDLGLDNTGRAWTDKFSTSGGVGYIIHLERLSGEFGKGTTTQQAISQYDEFNRSGLSWEHGAAFFAQRKHLAQYLIDNLVDD